jgi:hypothetical protein
MAKLIEHPSLTTVMAKGAKENEIAPSKMEVGRICVFDATHTGIVARPVDRMGLNPKELSFTRNMEILYVIPIRRDKVNRKAYRMRAGVRCRKKRKLPCNGTDRGSGFAPLRKQAHVRRALYGEKLCKNLIIVESK